MSDAERFPSKPKLLVLGSAALAVVVAAGIVTALVFSTTTTGQSVPTSSPTASSTAATPDEPKTDSTATPSPSPSPPVAGNPDAERPLPRASGPKPGSPGAEKPPAGGSVPEVGAPAPSVGIVLGRTTDELGQPHALVLNVAPAIQEVLLDTNELFAVVSGSTTFYVTGDAAVGAWRFGVDSSGMGDAAPIVVIKRVTDSSVQDLAADPSRFAEAAALNEDALATSVRLSALIATVLAETDPMYAALSHQLQEPTWTGVLVFAASVLALPGQVQGQSTGGFADTQVAAFDIGFEVSPLAGTNSSDPDAFFGTVDYARPAGDPAPPGGQYLRAGFANSALTFFEIG
ncbi:MAG: hypothetical protein JWP32_2242 [Schumannella sp.]|nr:hypothetical protein [Schumannella sp.]